MKRAARQVAAARLVVVRRDRHGPTLRTGNVSQTSGAYSIHYIVDWLSSTRHLRVRSAGGAVSPGFYVKSEGIDGYCGA